MWVLCEEERKNRLECPSGVSAYELSPFTLNAVRNLVSPFLRLLRSEESVFLFPAQCDRRAGTPTMCRVARLTATNLFVTLK